MCLADTPEKLLHFYRKGIYYGYPKCCIKSFNITMGALMNPKGAMAGQDTGFIPCESCAERVLSGEFKLHELIKDRHHHYVFPWDILDDEEIEQIIKVNKFN